jgi:hypothetical protein
MTVNAKTLLKDKFWIVEQEGQRLGTLTLSDDRYLFASKSETYFFDNLRQMKKKFGAEIVWTDSEVKKEKVVEELSAYGYPTSVAPFNSMFDVKKKLPLFTKSHKSKSLYCAGYYIIKFDKGWVKSFCPKLITIDRYESRGPFKTEIEMRQELSNANR